MKYQIILCLNVFLSCIDLIIVLYISNQISKKIQFKILMYYKEIYLLSECVILSFKKNDFKHQTFDNLFCHNFFFYVYSILIHNV